MDFKYYRIVPAFNGCHGCTFFVLSKPCWVAGELSKEQIGCWLRSELDNRTVFIKKTEGAYEQYCTDKLKWTLKTTD
jgi:hypothetical protein